MFRTDPNVRVVVTSYGFCSPAGFDDSSFARALTHDASNEAGGGVADEEINTELARYVPWSEQRRMDRITRFGVHAALSCFTRSGLQVTDENRQDVGGIFSCVYGPIASTRDFMLTGMRGGIKSASPLLFPYTVCSACPGVATILLGIRGFSSTVSGSNPITYSFDTLQGGRARALVTGGLEELTPDIRAALQEPLPAGAEATEALQPITRPSEGAAVVLMETLEHATARGAQVLLEMCGYGQAVNLTREPAGVDNMGYIDPESIRRAMDQALATSGVDAEQVGLVVSLAREDNGQTDSELTAIDAIWGEGGRRPTLRYPKKHLGETFAASDTFNLIASYFYHLHDADAWNGSSPERYAMVNSYQIGGNVSSTIVRF